VSPQPITKRKCNQESDPTLVPKKKSEFTTNGTRARKENKKKKAPLKQQMGDSDKKNKKEKKEKKEKKGLFGRSSEKRKDSSVPPPEPEKELVKSSEVKADSKSPERKQSFITPKDPAPASPPPPPKEDSILVRFRPFFNFSPFFLLLILTSFGPFSSSFPLFFSFLRKPSSNG
jgi:hypothetical protein